MKILTMDPALLVFAEHVLQSYMAQAPLEEVGYIAGLARAYRSAQDLPEGPEVVKVEGPVVVEIDEEDIPFGGTD